MPTTTPNTPSKDITTKVSKPLETAADFPGWKWTMTLLLKTQGVMDVVDGTRGEPGDSATAAEKDEFEKLNCKALLLIAANVEPNQMAYIMPHQLAAHAWTELHRVYQQDNLAFQFYLRSKWESLRQEEGETVQDYAKKTRGLILELSAGQIQISAQEAILKMLRGVQLKYKQVATTLQYSGRELTIEMVEATLRAAELQEGDGDSDITPTKAFMAKGGKLGKGGARKETRECFFCNKLGHLKKDCYSFKRQQEKEKVSRSSPAQPKEQAHHVFHCSHKSRENEGDTVLKASHGNPATGRWFVDSGATRHLCSQAELLKDLKGEADVKRIFIGDGSSLDVLGSGSINLHMGTGEQRTLVEIKDVLYVPQLAGNLLSVSQLVEKGVQVGFGKTGCTLTYQGKCLGTAKKEGKLFCFQATHQEEDQSKLWHDRLGHPGHQALRQLIQGEYVKGLPTGLRPSEGVCEGCLKGKQARKPFPATAQRREEEPLALTHIDLCGPMQVDSLGGAKYTMMLVDDATRHKTVFLLKRKSEAAQNIINTSAQWRQHSAGR
jgi:hypothetical protein